MISLLVILKMPVRVWVEYLHVIIIIIFCYVTFFPLSHVLYERVLSSNLQKFPIASPLWFF